MDLTLLIFLTIFQHFSLTSGSDVIKISKPDVYLKSSSLCPNPLDLQSDLASDDLIGKVELLEPSRYRPCLFKVVGKQLLNYKAELFAINSVNQSWGSILTYSGCKGAFQWSREPSSEEEELLNLDDISESGEDAKKFICQSRPLRQPPPSESDYFLDIWTNTQGELYLSPSHGEKNWLQGRYIIVVFMIYLGSTCSHLRVQQYINTEFQGPRNCSMDFEEICGEYECSRRDYLLRKLGFMTRDHAMTPLSNGKGKGGEGPWSHSNRKLLFIRNVALIAAVFFICTSVLYKLFMEPYKRRIQRELTVTLPQGPSSTERAALNQPRGAKTL